MKKRALIGCDPEFFLSKDGKLVSAIPFIAGTKHKQTKLSGGVGLQRDNVALEFSCKPAQNTEEFVETIRLAFIEIIANIPKELKLNVIPSANFDPKELEDPEAQMFGCDPDYDAWSIRQNTTPFAPDTFRSCGGHIHVGKVKGDGNNFLLDDYGKIDVVRTMDTILGIISVVLDNSKEAVDRRRLYGKAGCHRPTNYGVEYRVLSNFWLKSPILVALVDSLTQDSLKVIREQKHTLLIDEIGEKEIQRIINEGDVEKAKNIITTKLFGVISAKSKALFEEALNKINTFIFEKEWTIGETE